MRGIRLMRQLLPTRLHVQVVPQRRHWRLSRTHYAQEEQMTRRVDHSPVEEDLLVSRFLLAAPSRPP